LLDKLQGQTNGAGERYLFYFAADRKLMLLDGKGRVVWTMDAGMTTGERTRVATGHFVDAIRKDILISIDYPSSFNQIDRLYHSQTGEVIWTNVKGINSYPAVADVRGTGYDDLLGAWYFTYHHIDGKTGQSLVLDNNSAGYHHLALVDVNGDGKLEAIASGAYMSIYCTAAATGKRLWQVTDLNYSAGRTAGMADVDDDGLMELGIAFMDGRFNCYNGATGELKWTLNLGGAGSDCMTADVDGDGRNEFIVGSHDEHLWAIAVRNGQPVVLWRYPLPGAVGSPVAADVNGDGLCEILVAAGDGYLYCIGGGKAI
jgi:outer membrane protein assembly factor BamB